jgi:hypothetical protein
MHLHEITSESLTKALGVEVPDVYVVIAKHSVMGMDSEGIKNVLGCELHEIAEVESEDLYKAVRAQVSMAYAKVTADQSTSWDSLENIALTNLLKRIPHEKDSEFLLKVAAVANKAQRKHDKNEGVLDPSKAGRTAIVLTTRLVERLNRHGDTIRSAERTLSIHDGSMANPSFNEVDELLTVRNTPVLPKNLEISTRNADPSVDDLIEGMFKEKAR